ncbi:hypothetical protein [Bradyrhizobium septentrionale]|uniref:Uncharacterized protein n=1 Tax=Bradyrhizobium septentrionale TaxID=1404411 RepID=A0A974A228_9BRAD|nr:hypothetical protein [Bradyrhizobium septentrionale]UGY14281.1 hypothetical protein HAP48_0037860 [Bradyrhizobium septentrionale]UGY23020.1 hypothetical protein HU675_0034420 [Bradyrhizobium septentrionale]
MKADRRFHAVKQHANSEFTCLARANDRSGRIEGSLHSTSAEFAQVDPIADLKNWLFGWQMIEAAQLKNLDP